VGARAFADQGMGVQAFSQAFSTRPGDIFLGDKGFCSYYDVDKFQKLGVDSVISLGVRKPVATASALKVLAHNDLLIQWPRPKTNRTLSYSKEEWQAARTTDIAADKGGCRQPGM